MRAVRLTLCLALALAWAGAATARAGEGARRPQAQTRPGPSSRRTGRPGRPGRGRTRSLRRVRRGRRARRELWRRPSVRGRKAKVAVFFGTFDPIHEGHARMVRKALEAGFDEVVLVPNAEPSHKKNATALEHREAMISARIAREKGVNLYVGDSREHLARVGFDGFVEHIKKLYGADSIHLLVGQDAYETWQGKVSPELPYDLAVATRKGHGAPGVPAGMRDRITVIETGDDGVSSSAIRRSFRRGRRPSSEQLDRDVSSYIVEHGLYRR